MTALGSLLCTCAHPAHARKDRHESVCTPWHTLVAEAPDPLCEIHTMRCKCGIAECTTPPAAVAALHLRVQDVLYATRCVLPIRGTYTSGTYSTLKTPSTHIPYIRIPVVRTAHTYTASGTYSTLKTPSTHIPCNPGGHPAPLSHGNP
eukprot:363096-Chlamydomonas_euryale.AAC.13